MSGIVKGASIVGNIISGARLVGGMIIDGINTVINYKKAKAMNTTIHTLNKRSSMNNEQIIRVRNHLLHVSKASLADIKRNRDHLYQFDKELVDCIHILGWCVMLPWSNFILNLEKL